MLDRIQLKREAKEILRGARVSPYLVAFIYLAIINILSAIDIYVDGSLLENLQQLQVFYPEIQIPAFLRWATEIPAMVVIFVSVLATLLIAVINAGWALYHLGVRRGEEMECTALFDGFSFVGKVILLNLAVSVSITLWTFVFVIPGIIAAYRLRFAVYNLCENPEIGILEAMNMSTAQTRDYKMDLFVLDLTFLGWSILSLLTLDILSIWITPYITQTNIGYFQEIKRIKGIGWFPPQENPDDGQFHSQDPFTPQG